LPPGFMKDHWELYRKRQWGFKCASFSTFWRVSSNLHCARMFQFFWFFDAPKYKLTCC
jgi:hypothetical protein